MNWCGPHDPDYITQIFSGELPAAAQREIGFPGRWPGGAHMTFGGAPPLQHVAARVVGLRR